MSRIKNQTIIQCPVCKAPVEWNDSFPQRPFCSKRCQQIDFGDWATEAHVIPAGPAAGDKGEQFDEFMLDEMGIKPE